MDATLAQARTHFFQGISHFEGGRLEQARAAFEASLALAPGRPSVLGNLGVTLFHLKQAAQAVPLLQQATAGDPDYLDAWTCLGFSLETLGRWPEAVKAFERALALAPGQAPLWFRKGQCLMRIGQMLPALQAFEQAVTADAGFADAWSARGGVLRDLQRLPEAAACFERALACGGDPELNRYYLASVGGTPQAAPPRRYVETLFDDYAADFQDHVLGDLRYQGYERLLRPLVEENRSYGRALDLGCGTGLCAPLLQQVAGVVDGVDLSAAMLAQARRLGIYRRLEHADVAAWLEAETESAGLVVAADVFIYVGALERVFRAVRGILAPQGTFAFTVELAAGEDDLRLLPSLRYAHSERYIRRLAQDCGFQVERLFRAPVRVDQGRPLEGLYCYLA
ncbi:MAG TPA: tetratricopeptide repeat protein [Noviherbaspirillum sp.]|jgi:predicted TPR repeat methyltransferase|uniref:tetratricopeptide repeat protein n=1 Tax=Noviherbaspirillum sp. TaxID=1926288 RepID=UPI002F944830